MGNNCVGGCLKASVFNCLTSSILSVLLCRGKCQIDNVAKMLAYFPPKPATYTIKSKPNGQHQQLVFQLTDPELMRYPDAVRAAHEARVYELKTELGFTTHAVHFVVPSAKYTILYSHSNAMDLGIMMDFFHKLSRLLNINMFCYEYTGYGCSLDTFPTEKKTYADVESAYAKLQELGVAASQIIAYGQSVGSGPSCYLAAKYRIGGLILHGSLTSGLGVVSRGGCCKPSTMFCCCDIYPNRRRVKKAVVCPTLVMHGRKDEVIDFSHGNRMHKATHGTAKYPPYWSANAGHNNLLETDPSAYIESLKKFLQFVDGQGHESEAEVDLATTPPSKAKNPRG